MPGQIPTGQQALDQWMKAHGFSQAQINELEEFEKLAAEGKTLTPQQEKKLVALISVLAPKMAGASGDSSIFGKAWSYLNNILKKFEATFKQDTLQLTWITHAMNTERNIAQLMRDLESGKGTPAQIDQLVKLCGEMYGLTQGKWDGKDLGLSEATLKGVVSNFSTMLTSLLNLINSPEVEQCPQLFNFLAVVYDRLVNFNADPSKTWQQQFQDDYDKLGTYIKNNGAAWTKTYQNEYNDFVNNIQNNADDYGTLSDIYQQQASAERNKITQSLQAWSSLVNSQNQAISKVEDRGAPRT